MLAVAVRGEPCGEIEIRVAARNEVEHGCARDATEDLRHGVRQQQSGGKATSCPQADGNSGVEMTARDRAERIRTRQHRETESQRHPEQSDADGGKGGREDRAAATPENEPERPDKLR